MKVILDILVLVLLFFPLMSRENDLKEFLDMKDLLTMKSLVCELPVREEKKERTVHDIIKEAALESGLDYKLLLAVAKKESNLKPTAVSPVGAKGVMQLMPVIIRKYKVTDPFDPEQNIRAGVAYLSKMINRFGLEHGLAAYNAGPATVIKYNGVPPYRETEHYVRTIIKEYGLL